MTPARFGENMENDYLMYVLRGIEQACRENGQDILISPISEDDPDFDYLKPYRQRKVDGMIYVSLKAMPDEMVRDIEERSIPCVVLADRPAHAGISWIDTANEEAAFETTKRIWEAGHRRIAFLGIVPDIYNPNVADRERGFRRAIRELSGTEASEDLIIRSDYSRTASRIALARVLSGPRARPTAVFCSTDNKVLAAIAAARELRLSIPEDLSIVGFDGFLKDSQISPTIASNEQPLVEMGRRAAEVLLERIAKPNLPKEEIVFPVTFVPGGSLASPKA
jgi:LacI family transcriptional regulator